MARGSFQLVRQRFSRTDCRTGGGQVQEGMDSGFCGVNRVSGPPVFEGNGACGRNPCDNGTPYPYRIETRRELRRRAGSPLPCTAVSFSCCKRDNGAGSSAGQPQPSEDASVSAPETIPSPLNPIHVPSAEHSRSIPMLTRTLNPSPMLSPCCTTLAQPSHLPPDTPHTEHSRISPAATYSQALRSSTPTP